MMRTRKTRLALGAFLALSMLASACSCEGKDTGTIEGGFRFTAEQAADGAYLIPFGPVAVESRRTLTYEISNTGGRRITIARPELQSPVSTDIPLDGISLDVNETARVAFIYSPEAETTLDQEGTLETSVGEFKLRFSGKGVKPQIVCGPTEMDFGMVERDATMTMTLTCENSTDIPVKLTVGAIQGVNSANFIFRRTFEAGNSLTISPKSSQSIDVQYNAIGQTGLQTANFQVYLVDNGEESPLKMINLSAEVVPSALVAPDEIDFGFSPVRQRKTEQLVLTNVSRRPVTLMRLEVVDEGDAKKIFTHPILRNEVIPPDDPNTEEAENVLEVELAFVPADLGVKTGKLKLLYDANGGRADEGGREVSLKGYGGGPTIACTQNELNFGPVMAGVGRKMLLNCWNSGVRDDASTLDNLVIENVDVVGTAGGDFSAQLLTVAPALGFEPENTFQIEVTYHPSNTEDGVPHNDTLVINSNAGNLPVMEVNLTGIGRILADCNYEIIPRRGDSGVDEGFVRFGIVDKGQQATLEFAIVNKSTEDACLLWDIQLDGTSHEAFAFETVSFYELPPAGEVRFPVTFAPAAYYEEAVTGRVNFTISNKVKPNSFVDLRGVSQIPCARLAPESLDFGTTKPGCSTRERSVAIINICDNPITLRSTGTSPLELPAGTSDEFHVVQDVLPGTTLERSHEAEFTLAYSPTDLGEDRAQVWIWVDGIDEPYMVSLRGNATNDAIQRDSFEQDQKPKVDVLWVMDNSGSMIPFQEVVADNAGPFLEFAEAQGIDYHIGVTTSGITTTSTSGCNGGSKGGEAGRLFPVDGSMPRIITPHTIDRMEVWKHNIHVGDCHATEKLLQAAYLALTPPLVDHADAPASAVPAGTDFPNDGNLGFLRPDAYLNIVFLTDEDGDSNEMLPIEYFNEFQRIKGWRNTNLFKAHAIVGDKGVGCSGPKPGGGTLSAMRGDKFIQVVEESGGVFQSICQPDWEENLRKIGNASFGVKTRFFLTSEPEDTDANGRWSDGEIRVYVNGRRQARTSDLGAEIWTYDSVLNAVDFTPLFIPKPGDEIEIEYTVACG